MHYRPKHNALDQKYILVTGASDGIGREAALTYARYGASVLLLGRNERKLHDIKKIIDSSGLPEARVLVQDLACTEPKAYQDLAKSIKDIPHLDGLLNNAGLLGDRVPMISQRPTHWLEVISVNINGTFMLTQALLPLLLKAKSPSLIFSTSSLGRQGRANWGAYSVSKFATEGMMQVFSAEYSVDTLRVNCINPGPTRTRMRVKAYPLEDPSRLKTPKEIMPIYLYLMDNNSRYKTGISFDAQCYCDNELI